MAAIQYYMPGTIVKFRNKECTKEVGNNVEMFYHGFWAFKPYIDAYDNGEKQQTTIIYYISYIQTLEGEKEQEADDE